MFYGYLSALNSNIILNLNNFNDLDNLLDLYVDYCNINNLVIPRYCSINIAKHNFGNTAEP